MRREAIFNRTGSYGFVLESNVLLHRQAAQAILAATRPVLSRPGVSAPLRILDLACGGMPSTPARLMTSFPEHTFHYTGIDINPDQIAQARAAFRFPDNVADIRLIEGNAWDLSDCGVVGIYDLIYSGMNLHHGTPEEIYFVGLQVRELLSTHGLFVSHDVYRPDHTPYRRRPDSAEGDPGASFRLVAPEKLSSAAIPQLGLNPAPAEPEWRLDYVTRMRATLLERGGDGPGAEATARHMLERDYPISTREFADIFQRLGFRVRTERYEAPEEPLAPYIAMCTAWHR